jgi:hypothetical protein
MELINIFNIITLQLEYFVFSKIAKYCKGGTD